MKLLITKANGGVFTSHIGHVGLVPASDEVAVEVDHDHTPVVSLEQSVQSCMESAGEHVSALCAHHRSPLHVVF